MSHQRPNEVQDLEQHAHRINVYVCKVPSHDDQALDPVLRKMLSTATQGQHLPGRRTHRRPGPAPQARPPEADERQGQPDSSSIPRNILMSLLLAIINIFATERNGQGTTHGEVAPEPTPTYVRNSKPWPRGAMVFLIGKPVVTSEGSVYQVSSSLQQSPVGP